MSYSDLSFKPSPRRSIHDYTRYTPEQRQNMGRYGINSRNYEAAKPSHDHGQGGTDEVDNIARISNHRRSPEVMRKPIRRQSLTPPHNCYSDFTDSDESNALAKSLPASLPSHSNYSEDIEHWRTPNQSTVDRSHVEFFSPYSETSVSSTHANLSQKIIVILVALSSIIIYGILNFNYNKNVKYDQSRFYSDIKDFGDIYQIDRNQIMQIQSGISTIFKREDTSCVILTYNNKRPNFDSNKFDSFVNNVVSASAKFLRNDTAEVRHVAINGLELEMKSHYQLVKKYIHDMEKTGVILINNLDDVPSSLAMAFHYYCDEYNPLVKKTAIFFTLNSAKCHNSDEKPNHASVEKCLAKKWNTIPKDNIGPLLTRLVSIVIDVSN